MHEVETVFGKLPIDRHPDTCPHCNVGIESCFLNAWLIGRPDEAGSLLEIVYRCIRNDCGRIFVSIYERRTFQGEKRVGNFNYQRSYPHNIKSPEVNTAVSGVSPMFKEIYSQAAAAEYYELNEIAGVGYRKALEFLIKDYCISIKPQDEDQIKSKLVGAVIDNYIEDENLKSCAKRAAWLGNDETHYVRKWDDKDIEDLKALIELSCAWITTNVLTKKYLNEMA